MKVKNKSNLTRVAFLVNLDILKLLSPTYVGVIPILILGILLYSKFSPPRVGLRSSYGGRFLYNKSTTTMYFIDFYSFSFGVKSRF